MRSWLYVDISEKSHRVTFFKLKILKFFFVRVEPAVCPPGPLITLKMESLMELIGIQSLEVFLI